MITLNVPDKFVPERNYIIDVLLSEFLGLEYRTKVTKNAKDYEIKLENSKTLLVRDHFFKNFEDGPDYINVREIPVNSMFFAANQFSPDGDIPVIFGTDELTTKRDGIICGIDIFASSFFMLTRWEELANKKRDSHNRFQAIESLAYKRGFLHRAVVNEYAEMLWKMLSHLKCGQERKKRTFRTFATHDVDTPFLCATKGPLVAAKEAGGDLIKRRNPKAALHNFTSWLKTLNGHAERDPYNTFGYIMDISERHGLQSTFLFMANGRRPEYDLGHRFLRGLMGEIYARGHSIGLHSSYSSYDDPVQTKLESDMLRSVCSKEGIDQKEWMSRQHFLRWETPITFNNLESSGMDYDSTLSYADHAGFRCGVCYEYPAFDILSRNRFKLRERPLLVMECTVIDRNYMNMGPGEKAFSFIKSIKDTCRRFKGDFIILWHNTRFIEPRERQLYSLILQA